MKHTLLAASLALSTGVMAQLPPNSVAPDFTATDINGVQHHLYDYLDQGYTVILDISAAWCGPCWSYHNSGNLENLYNTYGPNTPEDRVMVIFIEGESTNSLAQITGSSTGSTYATFSQGDWTANTPYPIIDNASIADDYQISYFPTIYKVCPSRKVTEVGQITTAALWAEAQGCPAAQTGTNAAILGYTGETLVCDAMDVPVIITNMGTNPLTSVNVAVKQGATILAQQTCSGSLATYNETTVTLSNVNITNPSQTTITITTPDVNAGDNTYNPGFVAAPDATVNVTFTLNLDYYCAETTWELYNSNGTVVQSGGPYDCDAQNGGGADANSTKTYNWNLPTDCYKLTVFDAYGDGLYSQYSANPQPNGDYNVIDGTGQWLLTGSANFGEERTGGWKASQPAGVEESVLDRTLAVYPNPTNGVVNVSYRLETGAPVSVEVMNVLGERVFATNNREVAGLHTQIIDLDGLSDGLYFFTINAGDVKSTRKITLSH